MRERSLESIALQAEAVRDLLADEHRWITMDEARNAEGEKVSPYSREACQFCLVGAIKHVTNAGPVDEEPVALLIANTIRNFDGTGYVPITPDRLSQAHLWQFNDNRGHSDVMEVLHTAAAMARGAL